MNCLRDFNHWSMVTCAYVRCILFLENMKKKRYQAVEPNYIKLQTKPFRLQPGKVVAPASAIRYTGAYTYLVCDLLFHLRVDTSTIVDWY